MQDDTNLGGPISRFPATRWSAIIAARSNDAAARRRALETLASAYWKPIYKYIRLRWNKTNEDAKDLTQGFLLGSWKMICSPTTTRQKCGFALICASA